MKPLLTACAVIGLTLTSQTLLAGQVTSSFADGDTLDAAKMNEIKSAVNDNDGRITSLESASTTTVDFSGYGMPFAAIGAPKNVAVLISEDINTGQVAYFVRSRYANDTEQVSINGVPNVRPFIANYVFVVVDSGGNILQIGKSIEAPLTTDYLDYVVESSAYDPVSLVQTVTGDTTRQVFDCAQAGAIRSCAVSNVTTTIAGGSGSTDGAVTGGRIDTRLFSLAGSRTYQGIAYDDVRFETRLFTDFSQIRVRAKGVGEIKRIQGNSYREAIFYRVNGQTAGSLSGTPFAPGGPLEGLFF